MTFGGVSGCQETEIGSSLIKFQSLQGICKANGQEEEKGNGEDFGHQIEV